MKSQIPHCQLASYFSKPLSQNRNSTSVLAEDKKHVFPKTKGNIQDIVKNKAKKQSINENLREYYEFKSVENTSVKHLELILNI